MTRFAPLAFLLLGLAPGCATHRIATLESEIVLRDQHIVALTEQNQGYLVRIDTLQAEVDRLDKKNKELVSLYEGILRDFGPQVESGQAALVIYPDRTTLVVGQPIGFATGSAELPPGSAEALDQLAAFLKSQPARRFQVEGHTDAAPIHNRRYASNWELGSARAVAVVDALVARGVDPNRLSAATFADTEPLASNSFEGGMTQNRRIAVSVETSMAESGAHARLLEAARAVGGPVYAWSPAPSGDKVATLDPG